MHAFPAHNSITFSPRLVAKAEDDYGQRKLFRPAREHSHGLGQMSFRPLRLLFDWVHGQILDAARRGRCDKSQDQRAGRQRAGIRRVFFLYGPESARAG